MPNLLTILLVLFITPASATTYYVSQDTGNDTRACTAANEPCATIRHALSLLTNNVGGTICVTDSATYTARSEGVSGQGHAVLIPISGQPSQYVQLLAGWVSPCGFLSAHPTISAYNGGSGPGSAQFTCVDGHAGSGSMTGISYVEVGGFNCYGGADVNSVLCAGGNPTDAPCNNVGIELVGHHLYIHDNTVYNTGCAGIAGVPPNYRAGSPGPDNSLDYLNIERNVVHNVAMWSPAGCSGISLYELTNYDSGPGITCRGDTSGKTYHNCILRNWVYAVTTSVPETGSRYPADNNGCIIDDSHHTQHPNLGAAYTGYTLVANNILSGNSGTGCHAYKSDNITFVYNTAYRNNLVGYEQRGCNSSSSCSAEIGAFYDSPLNIAFYNNIAYGTAGQIYTMACWTCKAPVYDYNAQYNTRNAGTGLSGAHDVTAGPNLVNPAVTGDADFRPNAGSPVVNAASTADYRLNIDFYGASRPQDSNHHDIGAAQH